MNAPVTQKTMAQILEETINAYTSDTCAVDCCGACVYLAEDGRMCAVGRCLTNPAIAFSGPVSGLGYLDEWLKPEYRGHSTDFWQDLQVLHDQETHWNSDGITKEGLEFATHLANEHFIPLSDVPSLNS